MEKWIGGLFAQVKVQIMLPNTHTYVNPAEAYIQTLMQKITENTKVTAEYHIFYHRF